MNTTTERRTEIMKELVSLQTMFNNKTNGECWVDGVTKEGKDIDWILCMQLEVCEAIDSLPWKHWKNIDGEGDIDNVKIELVDTLHFLISEVITHGNVECLYTDLDAEKNEVMLKEFDNTSLLEDLKELLGYIGLLKYVEVEGVLLNDIVQLYIKIVGKIEGFGLEEVYKLYIGKNALNGLRQQHGYKDGSYIKIWDGSEDNVWLTEYMNCDDNDISYAGVMEALEEK